MRQYTESASWLARAKKSLAGGVSSEFRKFNHPHALFYREAKGAHIVDVDGNDYLDFTLSQGPLIAGHSHPHVLSAVRDYSEMGQLFAGQHRLEVELSERLQRHIPSAELMRFCLDGSEAVQTALRLARAKTGRKKFLRFEGHYHGWLDNVAWGLSVPSPDAMGTREHPLVHPWTEGLPATAREEFEILPWNDLRLVEDLVSRQHDQLAAIITEPIMCNNGCILPAGGFLEGIRSLCDRYGITLIFDEVITGFRMSLGGAQAYFGVTPDLSIFAKAMASGYPISAVVGRKEWMELIAVGKVIHAGTMNSGNPSVAAAMATLDLLEAPGAHRMLFSLGNRLAIGLRDIGRRLRTNLLVQGPGPMVHTGFTDLPEVKDFRDVLAYDKAKLSKFIAGLHDEGVRVIGRGLWYLSLAHTEADVDRALEISEKVLAKI